MDQLVAIDDIDGAFTPVPKADVMQVAVGPELVLVRGVPHALNPTASLVWQCFDGEGSLDELIADLAEATHAEEEVIRTDVLELTRQLARLGMLEGIAAPVIAQPQQRMAARAVEVGAELEPFGLPDMDGEDTEWSSFRGRGVLLVNWSPGCGFCVKIADELGRLQPLLDKEGVELVFVTGGGVEANESVFNDHGIDAPALVKQDGVDPFAGFGTPAAYLIDAEGKVAAPFAYGANEVPVLAREVAGVAEEVPDVALNDPQRVRYLPTAAAVCGGGGGAAPGKSTDWKGTRAYRFGAFHVGIRYNSEATAELLDEVFPGQRVDDPRTPDNYSVALSFESGRTRELNLLVKGAQQLVRSRQPERVVRGLLAYLSADLNPAPESLLRLRASVAVRGEEALLLPAGLEGWLKELQPRLARAGIQLAEVPMVLVDASAAELVIPDPAIDHGVAAIPASSEGAKRGSELPPVLPGRYPLRGWMVPAAHGDEGPITGALAVAAAIGAVVTTPDQLQGALDDVSRLVERVPPVGIHLEGPAAAAKEIVSALS